MFCYQNLLFKRMKNALLLKPTFPKGVKNVKNYEVRNLYSPNRELLYSKTHLLLRNVIFMNYNNKPSFHIGRIIVLPDNPNLHKGMFLQI